MNYFLTILEATFFFTLAVLHFHWALGGTFGFEAAIPTKENGDKLMNPKKRDSAIVGLALFTFGLFFLVKIGYLLIPIPDWVLSYAGLGIGAIFCLRAMGDFKYVGFTKKIKSTPFAIKDTKYYSPLCMILGTIALILA